MVVRLIAPNIERVRVTDCREIQEGGNARLSASLFTGMACDSGVRLKIAT